MARPEEVLARCPRCLVNPVWWPAPRTSRARGVQCYIWAGACRHSETLNSREVLDAPKQWSEHALRWNALVERLKERDVPATEPTKPVPVDSPTGLAAMMLAAAGDDSPPEPPAF